MQETPVGSRRRAALISAACLLIVSASVYAVFGLQDTNAGGGGPQNAFFTTDDGKTTFTDSDSNIPPFDHNGKPAVRAYLFTIDGGKTRWVQYLRKLPGDANRTTQRSELGPGAGLIKRPGDKDWVPESAASAMQIMMPKRPAGVTGGELEQVVP